MGLGSEYGVESEGLTFLPFVFVVLGFTAMQLFPVHP
jgi:hypothetical protein